MRIGVLTSGGDTPGMNAAIRAAVRVGLAHGHAVWGIRHGFRGLLDGDARALTAREVGGILDRGGTVLGSARCPELAEPGGCAEAARSAAKLGLDALVVIGGNGSQSGSYDLAKEGLHVVGVASTIDNDLVGSDMTIGADTALNTALEAVDRLRTTASSHERAFLVEVMGRHCGWLALATAVAGGAEAVVLPEAPMEPEELAETLRSARARGKSHGIVVVAEGARMNADALARWFTEHRERVGFELRVVKLGHVQRGGSPTAFDRLLATRLAAAAVLRLVEGGAPALAGLLHGDVAFTPLAEVAGRTRQPDLGLVDLQRILDR